MVSINQFFYQGDRCDIETSLTSVNQRFLSNKDSADQVYQECTLVQMQKRPYFTCGHVCQNYLHLGFSRWQPGMSRYRLLGNMSRSGSLSSISCQQQQQWAVGKTLSYDTVPLGIFFLKFHAALSLSATCHSQESNQLGVCVSLPTSTLLAYFTTPVHEKVDQRKLHIQQSF